jgi:hypothetical protein
LTAPDALLGELAVPRLVGTTGHGRVQDLLKEELRRRGLVVLEHRFRLPTRFGPSARGEGVNLIAVRPRARVRVWLAAHYDSKGQRLSMAARLVWLGLAGALLVAAVVATALTSAVLWWWLAAVGCAAGWLALTRLTNTSAGAVDNATGVLTALSAFDALTAEVPVGLLLLDAEELGLVGARALARERANLLADSAVINLDSIDDRGAVWALVHRPGPVVQAVAARLRARSRRRLPVVVDGMALAGATRECMTVMKGNWGTMGVVHRPKDVASRLTLEGMRQVAVALAEALAESQDGK